MKNTGFTTIELLIVFSIIAILSMVGIAAFVNYSRTQALNTATSELVTLLNTARSRAQSQVKPSVCSTQELNGYEVRLCGIDSSECINSSGYNYELDVKCGGNPHLVEGKKLPANITFSDVVYPPSSGKPSYLFTVLNGGVDVNWYWGSKFVVRWGYGGPNALLKVIIICPTKTLISSTSLISCR